jgi:hypothetical protein
MMIVKHYYFSESFCLTLSILDFPLQLLSMMRPINSDGIEKIVWKCRNFLNKQIKYKNYVVYKNISHEKYQNDIETKTKKTRKC